MRIATYNVEWFTELFDNSGALIENETLSGREGISKSDQLTALGLVFERMDADLVLIVEAPDQSHNRNCVEALENFAGRFGLRARKGIIGFKNSTQQEIAALYDPDKLELQHDPKGAETGKKGSDEAPRFDGVFRIDLDIDATEDKIVFSKPPLELAGRTLSGHDFRLIGAHLKSKAPHGADTEKDAMRFSISNRRKQLAQAIWLRQRIDQHLEKDESLIVLGDLNDGPGLDEYEKLFGRSSVEIIMGVALNGDDLPVKKPLFDPHAREGLQSKLGAIPTTARFFIEQEDRYIQAMLDYIMLSPDLMAKRPAWRIWHPFDTPECLNDPLMRSALLVASDHFPVTLDIDL